MRDELIFDTLQKLEEIRTMCSEKIKENNHSPFLSGEWKRYKDEICKAIITINCIKNVNHD